VTVYPGDCRTVLAELPEASVDSVVCDPPYHLTSIVKRFGGENAAPAKIGKTGAYARASAGFMGKQWDGGDIAFRVETWAEVFRVLTPGGHLIAFGGTRTYHRMVCAIEDAGFEIRDQIGWAYGSGFPKSHDVSKSIDRAGGLSPHEQSVLLRLRREAAGLSREQVAEMVGCTPASVRDWEEGRARAKGRSFEWIIPSDEYRGRLADALGYSADERIMVGVAVDRRGDGTIYSIGHSGELRNGGATEAAKQWQGWGTALKPAWEPIVLARKPLVGTVAENVLEHGTGALNIDGCRVESDGSHKRPFQPTNNDRTVYGAQTGFQPTNSDGRWPANLCHDGSEEVLAAFPGSAARFFYCAKANAKDRLGSRHPTVKPLALMQWLVRLVTPPDGVVLDPFAGSGTTGEAAWREGMCAILIELEAEYLADIERRLSVADKDERPVISRRVKAEDIGSQSSPAIKVLSAEVVAAHKAMIAELGEAAWRAGYNVVRRENVRDNVYKG
jgi:site-specific DNA-methyltransferase (adenine-specific)